MKKLPAWVPAALLWAATGLGAQEPAPSGLPLLPLPTLGGPLDDRIRVGHLLGDTLADGYLLRSPSTLAPPLAPGGPGPRWQLIAPELASVWNSEIPSSLNDGALWAGRGLNLKLLAGVRTAWGPVSLTLAPQVLYSQNRDFPIILPEKGERSNFSSPWFVERISADLPLRFGNQPLLVFDPGQSSLEVDAGPVAFGAATENQWWGPGIRNALVLSDHAAGFPHLFVRTPTTLVNPLGEWEWKWIAGGLTESLYFDSIAENDVRSLSAFVLAFRPAGDLNLTLGAARAVYDSTDGPLGVLRHAPDVFTRWDRVRMLRDTTATADSTWAEGTEQIFSLFARWVLPQEGFEAYAEWARLELPESVRDFLTSPGHSQGYTLGLQWAKPLRSDLVRLQAEVTYLEESASFKQRPVGTYYTSPLVPQGYTHRGKTLGAAIGPGSSSQMVALDYLAPRWQLGAQLGRVRWNTDAFYTTPSQKSGRIVRTFHAYDVSILGGLRAGVEAAGFRLGAEWMVENRLNFLFQNPDEDFTTPGTDVRNHQLRLQISPVRR